MPADWFWKNAEYPLKCKLVKHISHKYRKCSIIPSSESEDLMPTTAIFHQKARCSKHVFDQKSASQAFKDLQEY